jgi:hypothetical protein
MKLYSSGGSVIAPARDVTANTKTAIFTLPA